MRHALEVKFNERERQLVEMRRKEREEDAQNFGRHLTEELQRQHVSPSLRHRLFVSIENISLPITYWGVPHCRHLQMKNGHSLLKKGIACNINTSFTSLPVFF